MKIILLFLFSFVTLNAYEANHIKFENLTQLSNEDAIVILDIKSGDNYDTKKINDAIKKYYDYGFFDDISAYENDNTLTIAFKEKQTIVEIEIIGYKSRQSDKDELFEAMNIRKGMLYSKKNIDKSKKILLRKLEEEKYVGSIIETTIKQIDKKRVELTYNVKKGDIVIIKKINYHGLKNLTIEQIQDVTVNKQADSYSWWFGQNDGNIYTDQLDYDAMRIKDLYLKHGFLNAKVKNPFSVIDFDTNDAQIDFFINEGQQYKINDIIVYLDDNSSEKNEYLSKLRTKKDDIFDITKIRADISTLKYYIQNKGYAFAKVGQQILKNDENHTVDVILNVLNGDKVKINDVIISGNNRTLDRIIRRLVDLAPGDVFNLTSLKQSTNAIRRTGFFKDVKIDKQRVSSDKINLIVTVEETATGNILLGGGWGSSDGFVINASIDDKNIFGSGLKLGLSFERSSSRDVAKIELSNPSINDSKYNGNLKIYNNFYTVDNDSTDDDNDSTDEFGDQYKDVSGVSFGTGVAVSKNARVGLSYSIENTKIEYELLDTNNSKYLTTTLSPYYSFNNTDDYFVPREGMSFSTYLSIVGITGGDANYFKNTTSFKTYYSLKDVFDYDVILRYKTTISAIIDNGEIPDGVSQYMGGPSSVRGYNSRAFSPDSDIDQIYTQLFVNTIELSFPLVPKAKMRWSLFYDFGQIGEDKYDEIQKSGAGIVISWYSPVGPLQFIFARAIDPDPEDSTSNFEFSLGRTF